MSSKTNPDPKPKTRAAPVSKRIDDGLEILLKMWERGESASPTFAIYFKAWEALLPQETAEIEAHIRAHAKAKQIDAEITWFFPLSEATRRIPFPRGKYRVREEGVVARLNRADLQTILGLMGLTDLALGEGAIRVEGDAHDMPRSGAYAV